jgi:Domain of unknown function (DUF4126)
MEIVAKLGSLLGLSFISGINLYATVAVVGLCRKFELVHGLPPEFDILANDAVLAVAILLFVMEFVMDKVPGLDTLWDSIHTIIRPFGGAMLALLQVGESSPAMQVIVFMLGASLASAAHITKAGTRLIINTSPEPFSNILVSLAEDAGAIGFSYMSLAYPRTTFFLTLVCLAVIGVFMPLILRTVRMLFCALFFKLRCFLFQECAWTSSRALPYSLDAFFDAHRDADEKLLWTGQAYAVKIPQLSKHSRVQVIITSKRVHFLYRHWSRLREHVIALSELAQSKPYRGFLLSRWLLKTARGDWLLYLYPSLVRTLPQDLATRAGRDESSL